MLLTAWQCCLVRCGVIPSLCYWMVVASSAVQLTVSQPPPIPDPIPEEQTHPESALPSNSKLPQNADDLLDSSSRAYNSLDTYIVRFTRREEVDGRKQPEEVMLLKFRKEPWSIHLKWVGMASRGREVVYVPGQHGSKLHALLTWGDIPFVSAGKKMSFHPKARLLRPFIGRYDITDAGLGACISRARDLFTRLSRDNGQRGKVIYLGLQERTDFPRSLLLIEYELPPDFIPLLPQGGRRILGFDPKTLLPTLVQTFDPRGNEVEYYRYDHLQAQVGLDNTDFDPKLLWTDFASENLRRMQSDYAERIQEQRRLKKRIDMLQRRVEVLEKQVRTLTDQLKQDEGNKNRQSTTASEHPPKDER